ncbi:MAG: hypothetical protein GYA33_00085 [Thermogutta sp.]|nr:hypothetical protein [Thermogutta sp.]
MRLLNSTVTGDSVAPPVVPPGMNHETVPLSGGSKRAGPPRLHRLSEVRLRQGVSLRTMARRMNVDVRTVRQEEDPANDLPLSVIYRWQRALEVPLPELLSEIEEPLSAPVLKRARMLRLMKTTMSILRRTRQRSVRLLAQMLAEQLIEIMPELKDVNAWHARGRRTKQAKLGRSAVRRYRFRA